MQRSGAYRSVRSHDWRWLSALSVAVLIAYLVLTPVVAASDAMDYYLLDVSDPYANPWGSLHAFVYSPAYAQVLYP